MIITTLVCKVHLEQHVTSHNNIQKLCSGSDVLRRRAHHVNTVHFGWWCGVAATGCVESTTLFYGGPVSTWMGDFLRAGKTSRYETSQLGRLSLLSSV